MKIVGRGKLEEFCGKHSDAQKWIESWLADAEKAVWPTPHDIKARYASVSFLGNNLVIFNVKGNDYRLETIVAYKTAAIVVQWVGTHAEYDKRNKQR